MSSQLAHEAHCTFVLQKLISSLLDIYISYNKVARQIPFLENSLAEIRLQNPSEPRACALEQVTAITKAHLAARKAHDVAFKASLRNLAHSNPVALEKYVREHGER
jgi:hypothetical protein